MLLILHLPSTRVLFQNHKRTVRSTLIFPVSKYSNYQNPSPLRTKPHPRIT